MEFLSIKGWENFQHYKDRNPPWIKLHRDLLRDYDFACLQDASKLLLIELWLLSSQLDNKIPNDQKWLQRQLPYDNKINLKPLIDSGFIIVVHVDSNTLAECKQSAMPEAETEAYREETEKEELRTRKTWKKLFASWYSEYPKKVGKEKAVEAWAKVKPEDMPAEQDLMATLMNQKEFDQQWQDGTKFIPNPATYINQRRWNDEIQKTRKPETGFERNVRLANEYLGNQDGNEHLHGQNVDVDGRALPPPME